MVQRIAVRVLSFFLLMPCAAFCQNILSTDLGQRSAQQQRHQADLATPLPDAPSALIASQSDPSVSVALNHPSKPELKTFAATSGFIADPATLPPPNRALIFQSAPAPKDSGAFFTRYFDTSLSRQDSRYRASSKDTLMGRATDAASRIFVTRDEFGKRRLNTSYFVGVLTAVAVHSASRPYWARSNSMPLGDFGSTVGNDAGMNLMHEFGPGLRQAVAGHMPSIVFRVERRILRETNPTQTLSPHTR
jgi:hypothetical protein